MLQGPFPAGPARQEAVEARDDVLVFTSEPFEESLTIFGEVQATLFASSSAVDTDRVVRLCRLDSDGVSTAIAVGIVRASWRDAHAGTGASRQASSRPRSSRDACTSTPSVSGRLP
jgi:predicted acyl esterase